MIVADTGAIVALIDADDRHHRRLRALFEEDPVAWLLPWAILPEVDYLLTTRLGSDVATAFRSDLAAGLFSVVWGCDEDLQRAQEIDMAYVDLGLGLVDAVVIATAERLNATAIATLDLRDFGAVTIRGEPRLIPRDL